MSAHPSTSASILVADDQPDVLEALRLLLRREGYTVETASSPDAVIEALKQRSFDTLLIDLNYARDTTSGREGIELLSRVQALDNALPTIVMTGWASIDVAVEAMRHGAREFVQKPWDNEQLLAILRRQVAICQLLRRKRQAEAEKRREALMAAEAQRRLLPQRAPESQRLEFFASCQSARDVGGDFYDFIELGANRTALVVADVEGKGMPAALYASMVQAAVRSHSRHEDTASCELVASVNELLRTSAGASSYATLFYAAVDEDARTLTYVNAGHNPPLLIRSPGEGAGSFAAQSKRPRAISQRMVTVAEETGLAVADGVAMEQLRAGGPVIGLFEDCVYEEATVALRSGDLLVAYSDGLTESFNAEGEEFGEERLSEILLENSHLPAEALGQKVLESVRDWSKAVAPHDDLTLVIMKMK